jgi:glycosyltransferase involved in cell wall biosynthesis
VLAQKGYVLVSPRAVNADLLRTCEPETAFFVELGAGQYAEKEALLQIIKGGFINVRVTLHDPPFLTFPYFKFRNHLLNRISRGVDYYLGGFGMVSRALRQCRTVYVLSNRGEMLLRKRYPTLNVERIPHVIPPEKVAKAALAGHETDILFFGFVGKGKGLHYALEFHAEITKRYPAVVFHVVGEAVDDAGRAYLRELKEKYKKNVRYHGYVPEEGLDDLFSGVAHVFLPFNEYKYICPTSGSVINSMRRGRIVWTNPVNGVPELIQDGKNGIFFRKTHDENLRIFGQFMENPHLVGEVSQRILAGVSDAVDARPYRCVA